jgi:hypothetical protein
MSVDVGDIFAKSAGALRGIKLNFDHNLAGCNMKTTGETKK